MSARGLIVYAGKYGSTAQYAAWLSEATDFPAFAREDLPADWQTRDPLIVGSAVYGGQLRLRHWLHQVLPEQTRARVLLYSVSGLAPESPWLQRLIRFNLGSLQNRLSAYHGLPGRLIHAELDAGDRLLLKCEAGLGIKLGQYRDYRPLMDFNYVNREHLLPLTTTLANLI